MIGQCLCDLSLCHGDSLLDFLGLVLSLSNLGQVLHEQATGSEKTPLSLHRQDSLYLVLSHKWEIDDHVHVLYLSDITQSSGL